MYTKAIKNGLTDDVLTDLYKSGQTAKEISLEYGMTENGVLYRLRKLGIVKTNHQRNEERMIRDSQNGRSIYSVTKEELELMLRERGERQIAKEYGCSKHTIKLLRKKFDIKAYSKSDRIHIALPDWFTDEQLSMLYGSLLGDGNIHPNNDGTAARFKEGHCLKQEDYLRWKTEVLGDFVSKRGMKETGTKLWKDGREFRGISVLSRFHRNFLTIYNWFYDENGVKHLPGNFAEMITPLALAIWYMDDGSVHGKYPSIASCFDRSEVDEACRIINEKFGIRSFVPDKKSCDSVWIIHFDSRKFFEVVGDYILPGMEYKVTLRERFLLKCVNRPDLIKYITADTIGISIENIDELVDYCHICGFPYPDITEYDRGKIITSIKHSYPLICDGMIKQGNNTGNDFLIGCFSNYFLAHSHGRWPAKWHFDHNLPRVLRNIMEHNKMLTASSLRSELIDLSGIYGFRPAVAKQIYDRYCCEGAKVLDPCGGWGGRMLGAYCSDKVARYDCVDACADTKHGLDHVKMLLDRTTECGTDVHVSFGAYEDMKFEKDFYDVVFTSPPYFIKEYYSSDAQQSSERYGDSFYHWVNGFLFPFIERSYDWLRPWGKFIVNIGNVRIGEKFIGVADMFKSLMDEKYSEYFEYVETLRMERSGWYLNSQKEFEPVFVYMKR